MTKFLKDHVTKGKCLNEDVEKVNAYLVENYILPMCTKMLINFDKQVDFTNESMVEFHDSVYINLIESVQKYLSTMIDYKGDNNE